MKKLLMLVLVVSVFVVACKKDDQSPTNEEILKNKIEEVIPKKYLDTLEILGLTVNKGTTPPNVEGIYSIEPVRLLKSNISGDYAGMAFADAKLKLFNQSTSDFGIQLYGKHFLNINDTSIVTAISGSGTAFTVYGKVKSVAYDGVHFAIFAIIISGTIEAGVLKNVQTGLINIDETNAGAGIFIREGQARIVYDNDFISEMTTAF